MHSPARAALLTAAAAAILAAAAVAGDIDYPESRRTTHTDVYHGTTVEDPYRWLEEDVRTSEAVQQWVEAQNEITFEYLESIPERDAIRERLTKLWNYERFGTPTKVGGRYVFSRNDGLQNQEVVYVQNALDAEPEVLFDPNTWSEDGTVALGGMSVSPDGRYAAYAIAEAGSDWRTWRVRDIDAGTDLPDEVRWTKFTDAVWSRDGRGFFYGRYDEPAEGAFVNVNKDQKLYYHRLGTPQDQDVLVYYRPDQPDWYYASATSEDGRYLVINVSKGTGDEGRVLYKDLTEPYGMPVDLVSNFEAEYTFVGNDGPVFYFKTTLDAPLGRVIAIDLRDPSRNAYREIIPETRDTLRSVDMVGNMFACTYLVDARSAIRLHALDGRHVRDIDLPGIGSASLSDTSRTHTECFYGFSSYAVAPSVYRYDVVSGESERLASSDVDFDPRDYETTQVFYRSKDGTRVPMFITHRKGIELDGSNPTLLYGYGGFNIPLTPRFSITRLAWMEMGGVYAEANLRGGGEYGDEWHKAGTKLSKQNVFDDFIAAAEYLIDEGYTSPGKLAIQGGSNGGLLVGAVMCQRPDLFGAALPAVGVMDMLRFHEFTIGWAWTDDYGSSDDPEEFEALRAYSPYHNLRPGTAYPATLVTTADTDDRVVPGHSFKFAAALQYAHAGEDPVLIRIETRAGHGAGKPTSKRIEEAADLWAFLVENLDMSISR